MTLAIDLGKTAAKRSSRDEFLILMRQIIGEQKQPNQAEAVRAWLGALRNHKDYEAVLHEAAEAYVGNAMFRRCTTSNDDPDRERPTEDRARNLIISEIVLWTWALPTTGRPLSECTFAEVAEAAPVLGQFLQKLATQGAPGALVREVFDADGLQEFWRSSQSR